MSENRYIYILFLAQNLLHLSVFMMVMFTEDIPLTCRKLRLTTLNRIKGIPKNDNSGWLEMTMGNNSWQNWTTERKSSLLLTKKIFWLTITVKKKTRVTIHDRESFQNIIDLDQHHSSKLIKSSYISSWFYTVFCISELHFTKELKTNWKIFNVHIF